MRAEGGTDEGRAHNAVFRKRDIAFAASNHSRFQAAAPGSAGDSTYFESPVKYSAQVSSYCYDSAKPKHKGDGAMGV